MSPRNRARVTRRDVLVGITISLLVMSVLWLQTDGYPELSTPQRLSVFATGAAATVLSAIGVAIVARRLGYPVWGG